MEDAREVTARADDEEIQYEAPTETAITFAFRNQQKNVLRGSILTV